MVNFFDEMRRNKVITVFLVAFFFCVALLFGVIAGFFIGNIYVGLAIAAVIAVIYTLVVYYKGSNMILSLSNAHEVTKQNYPYLINTVEGLSIAAGLKKVPKLYIINDPSMNAFATGNSPEKSVIVLTKGLVDKMNRQEIEGVISHEMSHIKNNDIKIMILATVLAGVIIIIADIVLRMLFWGGGGFGRGRDNDNNALFFILLILGLVALILAPFISTVIKMTISRKREFLADANGAELTRYPEGLASALEKIRDENVVNTKLNKSFASLYFAMPKKQENWFVKMLSSHPPINERIKRLRAM